MAKHPVGGEGALRIRKLFALDAQWAKEPPQKRQELRQKFLAPMIDEFFLWTEAQYALSKGERGLVSTALGYAVRQKGALTTFLADGRLRMDNNASERALRHIAVGRKAWLFFGSDDHAKAAGNLFSLIASCKLHGLDPETSRRDDPRAPAMAARSSSRARAEVLADDARPTRFR